jgi:CBS-domain-containing membrane protein
MNVAFFLTPKSEVVWVHEGDTMRQALERMERHRYSAVPILDDHGRYVGTLTEGDLLWKLWHLEGPAKQAAERIHLAEVPRRVINQPVDIEAEVEELLSRAIEQNFVPVIDSRGVFIGIVRRRPIIEHCSRIMRGSGPSN